MSHPKVILTPITGDVMASRLEFKEPALCMIGRARDCEIMVPADSEHLDVSRHHCLLEIYPPKISVRDLGSLNGTYVNGSHIGARAKGMDASDSKVWEASERSLHDGDEIRVGKSCLVVHIADEDSGEPELKDRLPALPICFL